VSFRGLLDEIREQLAEELLVTGGLPVAEVAGRLGYLEVSSFSQAFRRWKGVGPRAYRARQPERMSAQIEHSVARPGREPRKRMKTIEAERF
jgi:AraC-like DNA-binding protein